MQRAVDRVSCGDSTLRRMLLLLAALLSPAGCAPRPPEHAPAAARAAHATPEEVPDPDDYDALAQDILELVETRYYAPARARAWAQRHRGYAREIRQLSAFDRVTDELLAELGSSHTAFFARTDPRAGQLLAIFEDGKSGIEVDTPGGQFVEIGARWVVAQVFAGGPLARAGVLRGDQVLTADGAPFEPGLAFGGRAGSKVVLELQRTAAGGPMRVEVEVQRVEPKREWAEAQERASRVIERDGKRIGYAWLWSCAGAEPEKLLADFVFEQTPALDGLVVDMRDGWGGCSPAFVNLFNPAVPELTLIGRDGARTRYLPSFRGRLVLLVNERTTSGKEVIAHAVKRHRRGVIVGETTAGAVLAGRAQRLRDDSVLYLAVADLLVDGERLEGKGVTPDVRVHDSLLFAAGADPQLERALEAALQP